MPKRQEPLGTSIATPRQHYSREQYTGAELQTRSNRPGAYDALQFPSLFNGKARVPGATPPPAPAVYVPPPPAPAPTPAARKQGSLRKLTPGRVSLTTYTPRAGSAPARVLSHLRKVGGTITYIEIAAQFGIPQATITASFKPALKKGALVRHLIDGHIALSLPGFTPPAPNPELLERSALLALRQAELKQWQEYVRLLGQRYLHIRTPILRPLFPPDHKPAA